MPLWGESSLRHHSAPALDRVALTNPLSWRPLFAAMTPLVLADLWMVPTRCFSKFQRATPDSLFGSGSVCRFQIPLSVPVSPRRFQIPCRFLPPPCSMPCLHQDRFYLSRIGIRMLIGQSQAEPVHSAIVVAAAGRLVIRVPGHGGTTGEMSSQIQALVPPCWC